MCLITRFVLSFVYSLSPLFSCFTNCAQRFNICLLPFFKVFFLAFFEHITYLMLICIQWQRFIKMSAYIIEINKFQTWPMHKERKKLYYIYSEMNDNLLWQHFCLTWYIRGNLCDFMRVIGVCGLESLFNDKLSEHSDNLGVNWVVCRGNVKLKGLGN